jgi:hypothetical protein
LSGPPFLSPIYTTTSVIYPVLEKNPALFDDPTYPNQPLLTPPIANQMHGGVHNAVIPSDASKYLKARAA